MISHPHQNKAVETCVEHCIDKHKFDWKAHKNILATIK